jgi:hypothetical protein
VLKRGSNRTTGHLNLYWRARGSRRKGPALVPELSDRRADAVVFSRVRDDG